MKQFIFALCFLAAAINLQAQVIPLDSIRVQDANGVPVLLNQIVTVQGTVTTHQEFGAVLVYFQSGTAGTVGYDAAFCSGVTRGDSVQITGKVVQYNGLTEFQPVNSFQILSSGKTVNPIVVTTTQARTNGEAYESRLIKINNITQVKNTSGAPVTQWTVSGSGTNFRIFSGGDSVEIRIYATSNIANTTIPSFPFSVTALESQFQSSPPYLSGYQILPRDLNDFTVEGGGPNIPAAPIETNITPTSVTLTFATLSAGDTKVKYFISDSLYQPEVYTDSVYDAALVTAHSITLNNLTPGKIYYATVSSTNSTGTSTYTPKYFCTASHTTSRGNFEVYFNKSIDASIAMPNNIANGNTDLKVRLGQRIDSAQHSIDMAIYSFDDVTIIRDKLINAFARGVKIRIVYDYRSGTPQALMQDLINAGIGVMIRPSSSYIMHNKFLIFDSRDNSSYSDDWLWCGSSNITTTQFNTDVQNVLLIQDESLCRAYTREFEEMWGSHNDNKNPALSKFGAQKLNNTPHLFRINNKNVECYFSPSDGVSDRIVSLIQTETNKSIDFCILTFTRFQIENAMKSRYNPPNTWVRGVFDHDTSGGQGMIFAEMHGTGGSIPWSPAAKVYLENYTGMLHHKYILIDPDMPSSNPVVETGSYNFSNAATSGNDENILIIYDSLIANQYFQEFSKRMSDAGGSIGIQKEGDVIPSGFDVYQNYPNPFNPMTTIKFAIASENQVTLKVNDILGREVLVNNFGKLNAGVYNYSLDASKLSSGVYFYTIEAGSKIKTMKMVVMK